jgi:peptide/nickel transport system permease protein
MAVGSTNIGEVPRRKSYPLLVDAAIRLVKEEPLATAGWVIVLVMIIVGIFADFLAPYNMAETHLRHMLRGPSTDFILGTDQLGRDLLSRIIHGARVSIIVSLASATLCVIVAAAVGLISGFSGGKFDLVVQRFIDGWMCFPPLFIILSIMALLGPGLTQVVAVIGFHSGIANSRVVRSAVMSVKENVYIRAAESIGVPPWRILVRHVLPNIMAPIIIIFTLVMAYAILAEATLSFLGFGVPPPTPSWGAMLSEEGRTYMFEAPWMAIWPGVTLALAIFGINMFGDGVRDVLDPRLRGGLGSYRGNRRTRRKKIKPNRKENE